MIPRSIVRTLVASSTTAVCALQTTAGAGNFIINGTTAVNIQQANWVAGTASYVPIAQLDAQRNVTLTSTGNISAVNFTITGTDQNGLPISETLAGPNNNTVTTISNFYTVTQVAVSAAVGTNTSVGSAATGASVPVPVDQYLTPANVEVAVEVSGTLNYTVQYTNDFLFNQGVASSPATITWVAAAANLTAQTAYADNYLQAPAMAIRLLTNSGSGTGTMIVRQAGVM